MRRAAIVLALLVSAPGLAAADGKKGSQAAKAQSGAGSTKVKSYDFSGLDVEGKLRTPQLLYFLHRMQAEFEGVTPEKRSFLPELRRSTDQMDEH
jgi:hypothetical protein